jgi:uncharacterized protein with von Willebrand factor type A (vWA) domain
MDAVQSAILDTALIGLEKRVSRTCRRLAALTPARLRDEERVRAAGVRDMSPSRSTTRRSSRR